MNQIYTKRNLRWTLIFCLTTICVLLGGCLVTVLVSRNIAAARLSEKLEKLANRGVTIGSDSFEQLHQANSSKDSVEDWVSILRYFSADASFIKDSEAMPILGKGTTLPPDVDQPWSEQVAVETFLASYRSRLDQAVELSQRNGPVTFPLELRGIATLLPHTQEMRQLARLLLLESKMAARAGDADREFRAINGVLGCSIALRGQPFMISQLVVFAIHRMAIQQLQSAVEGDRLKDDQLAILHSRLRQLSDFQSMYQLGLRGEISMGAEACRSIELVNPQRTSWASFLRQTGLADRAAYLYLEKMESAIVIETNDLKDFSIQIRASQPKLAAQSIFAMDQQIANEVLPAMSAFGNAIVEHAMVNRLAQLGIAVRRYEKANAALPTKIEDLQSLGINLMELTTCSGELPKYELVPTAGLPHRAVLWSFSNNIRDANGMNATAVPSPTNKKAQGANEAESPWWIWELK